MLEYINQKYNSWTNPQLEHSVCGNKRKIGDDGSDEIEYYSLDSNDNITNFQQEKIELKKFKFTESLLNEPKQSKPIFMDIKTNEISKILNIKSKPN